MQQLEASSSPGHEEQFVIDPRSLVQLLPQAPPLLTTPCLLPSPTSEKGALAAAGLHGVAGALRCAGQI